MSNFPAEMQAGLDASKDKVDVGVKPDPGDLADFGAKVGAALGDQKPVEVPVRPDMAGFDARLDLGRIAGYISSTFGHALESSKIGLASSAMLERVNESLAESFGNIRTSAAGAALSEKALAGINDSLAASYLRVGVAEKIAAEQAGSAAAHQALLAAGTGVAADATLGLARATAMNAALSKAASGTALDYALANTALGASAGKTTVATDQATTAATRLGGRWGALNAVMGRSIPLFGGMAPGFLGAIGGVHLLVQGVTEFGAVLIPATIAAGAFAAAAAPSVQDIVAKMQDLNTVTQATGQNIAPLSGGFQKVADAVKPQVYQLFGDALTVINAKTGAFGTLATSAGKALDTLGARAALALQSGGFSQFLKNAGPDLLKVGTLFGNVFGTIGNVLKQLPGYAQYAFSALNGVTHVIENITGSGVGQKILGFGMAAHGALIYAGLGATALGSAMRGSLTMVGNWAERAATAAAGSDAFGGALARAAPRMFGFAAGAADLAALPWGWIAAAAVGVGFLAYKFVTAGDAADAFNAKLNTAIQSAPVAQGLAAISDSLAQTKSNLSGASTTLLHFSGTWQGVGKALAPVSPQLGVIGGALKNALAAMPGGAVAANVFGIALGKTAGSAAQAAHDYDAYKNEIVSLNQQSILFRSHLAQVAVQFGGTAQAMGMLTAAGITTQQMLSKSPAVWAQIAQQVLATEQAYQAMGQRAGVLGADLNALSIAGSDQVSAMSKLNTAWDTTIGIVSGGQGAFVTFQQDLLSVNQSFLQTGGTGRIVTATFAAAQAAAKAAGASMNGLNGPSLQLRATWQTAYGGGAKLIDALRMMSSASPGGFPSITRATKDTIAQLVPFGKQSAATRAELVSLAQEVNPNIKSFQGLTTWLGNTHNAGRDLNKILAASGINLQNLEADAAAMSDTLQNAVVSKFTLAKMAADGTNGAISKLATDMGHGAKSSVIAGDAMHLFALLTEKGGYSARGAAALVSTLTGTIFKVPRGWTTKFNADTAGALGHVRTLAQAVANLHNKTITVRVNTEESNHITQIVSRLYGPGHAATGAVIPGYAPGVDDRLIAVGPGEGILVPEAVRGLGGPAFVHAANRKFGGPRVARGNKTGRFAAGGITESAHFGFPQDVFNFQIGPIGGGGSGSSTFTGFSELAKELRGFRAPYKPYKGESASQIKRDQGYVTAYNNRRYAQMETDGRKLVAAFSEGTLKTVSAIKSEAATAIRELGTYYKGPAATRLERAITRQSAAMEKLAAASAKVSATIAGMKAFSAQEVSSLQGFSALSNITGTTNAKTGATAPVTGAQIEAGLRKDLAQLRRFEGAIRELKIKKVARSLIEQVIAMGPVPGIQYADAILAGGSSLIAQIDKTERAIAGEETAIGHTSAEIQYGQNISKGFLSGLEKEKSKLDEKMHRLGDEIAKELARALGVPEKTLLKDEKIGRARLKREEPHHHHHHGHVNTPPHIIYHPPGIMHPGSVHVTVNLNGSKGKLSHEEIAAIKHEISAQLALSH
jgi:hypothetical protein